MNDFPPANDADTPDPQLALLKTRFAEQLVENDHSKVSYRSCGNGPTVVLLHGISSGAASWLPCALALATHARVIAWNAPGYGRSTPLSVTRPKATDYASRLEQMLQALDITDCMLVGHSLGALMAAAYLAQGGQRVSRVLLANPALGYGAPTQRERAREIEQTRLGALRESGIAGMAQNSARLLSAHASDTQHAWVRWNMQRLNPSGYTQAVHMLCDEDITRYLSVAPRLPMSVACGALDTVTTPEASAGLARTFDLPFHVIDAAGHASYIEQPAAFAAMIRAPFVFPHPEHPAHL